MSENQYPYYYYPQASTAYYPSTDSHQFIDPRQDFQQPLQPPQQQPSPPNPQGMLPVEQSYIENILRLNKGEVATVYMTFENNSEWNAKIFKGRIEAAGRDHIILSDLETNKRYLLLMIYLDYITFEGEINYTYPYNQVPETYPPR